MRGRASAVRLSQCEFRSERSLLLAVAQAGISHRTAPSRSARRPRAFATPALVSTRLAVQLTYCPALGEPRTPAAAAWRQRVRPVSGAVRLTRLAASLTQARHSSPFNASTLPASRALPGSAHSSDCPRRRTLQADNAVYVAQQPLHALSVVSHPWPATASLLVEPSKPLPHCRLPASLSCCCLLN